MTQEGPFLFREFSRYKQYTTEGADPAQFCYDSYINSRQETPMFFDLTIR
jgi:hypothetical protein